MSEIYTVLFVIGFASLLWAPFICFFGCIFLTSNEDGENEQEMNNIVI